MREDIRKRIEQIIRGEVPVGYTRTKEGVLPLEWKEKRLGQLAEVIMGQSPSSKHYNTNNEGKPLIQGNNDRTDRESDPKVWTTQITKECKTGDILMSVRAPVGTVFKSRHNACIGRGICAIRSVYSDYLFQFLIFHEDRWRKNAQGSTFESINRNEIESKEIPFCERDYLEIAETLSTCDRVIDLKKKLIEEKKKVKKWLMQTLLTGMIRVKDIENRTPYEELKKRIDQIRNGQIPEGYRKTELGIISHDWEITGLEKICKLIIDNRGKTPKKDSSDGDIPGLSAHNVKMGKIDFTFPTTYYSEDVFNRWMKNEKIEKEDIIMTTEAPLGNIALVEEAGKYILGQRVVALRLKDSVNSLFGKHLLMSNIFQRRLQELATGTTAKGLSKRNFKYLKIYIPDTETQEAVSSILSTADKEIDLLNKDLEQWELKKKSLMQLLLTGIVRTTA